jgi:Spy/CpxP family protein refolding chaperone
MVRRCFLGALLAMLMLSASMTANAQRGQGRGGFGGGGGLQLLRIPEVQKELKMTEAQIAKIDAKQDEVRESMRSLGGGGNFGDMTPEERQKFIAKMQEIQSKAANDILTDDAQKKRFRQLELQRAGSNAFTRADVATELKLTDDQKKQIADLQSKSQQEMQGIFQGAGDPRDMTAEERQKMQAKMQDLQKATGEKITGVLTDAQKTQWKEMIGAPFTFPPPQFGGRRNN